MVMTNQEMAHYYVLAHDEMTEAAHEMRAAQHLLVGISADMAWESHAARTFGVQVEQRIDEARRAAYTCDEHAYIYLTRANSKVDP